VGAASLNAVNAQANVLSIVEAYAGEHKDTIRVSQGSIHVLNGAGAPGTLDLDATSKAVAKAVADGASAGAIAMSSMHPTATLGGATRAYIGPRTTVEASTVTADAVEDIATARAETTAGGFGLGAVTELIADAKAQRLTEAFVGHHASLTLGSGSATFTADATPSTPMADASSLGVGVGVIASISKFHTFATIGPDSAARAFVGDNASVTAGNLTLQATSDTTANAAAKFVGISAFLSAQEGISQANNGQDTETYIGDDATVTLTGTLAMHAVNTPHATPTIASASMGTVSLTVLQGLATLDGDTGAWIGNGSSVQASSIDMDATTTDIANADISGFGFGLGAAAVVTAEAKDTGSAFVRIGPPDGSPGSSGNRTVVTATGAGGIQADAVMTSNLTSEPSFVGISVFATGTITKALATQQGAVRADVGGWADLTSAGDIHVRGSFTGATTAHASSVSASGAIAFSSAEATATHTPTVNSKVVSNADLTSNAAGGQVEIIAEHNHDMSGFLAGGAIASASSVSFSAFFADSASTVQATTNATVETLVEENATLEAINGSVAAISQSANTAQGSLLNIGASAVSVKTGSASPVANGSTKTRFLGNVGDGGLGAETLTVLAEGYTTADSSLNSLGGGAVDVNTGSANATATSSVTVDFGSASSFIDVGGDITVQGILTGDADSKANGASGGAVSVRVFSSNATSTPTVNVNVGAADVTAGGTLSILAQQGEEAEEGSDGTFSSIEGDDPVVGDRVPGGTNFITFADPHKLTAGAIITSTTTVGGLEAGRAYGVVERDATTIHLGESFKNTQVVTATDSITFPGVHNLKHGAMVYYFDNNMTPVAGLQSGKQYRVFVVDSRTIKLQDPVDVDGVVNVPAGAAITSDVTSGIVTAANTFENGDPVTYRAQSPEFFNSALTDADGNLQDFDNDEIVVEGHGWSTGQELVYHLAATASTEPSTLVRLNPALDDGDHVFAIFVSANRIRIASTQVNANNGVALELTPDKSVNGRSFQHSLRRTVHEALPGLTEGTVYFVSDRAAGSFRLKDINGNYVHFDDTGRTGGQHIFQVEGVNLTSQGGAASGKSHLLVLDLQDAGGGKFDGVGGASAVAGAPAGDRQVTASTTGVGGGFIDVAGSSANTNVTLTTNVTVASGAVLSAGIIEVLTDSVLTTQAVSDGAGGGFVSIGNASTNATGTNNSTIDIGTDAALTAEGDLTVLASTNTAVVSYAVTGNGGFIGVATASGTANLYYSTQVLVDGDLEAGDTLTVKALTQNADATATGITSTGGLGADGEAFANVHIGYYIENNILVSDPNRARTVTEIRDDANLLATDVALSAIVEKLRAVTSASTDVVAVGAGAVANANSLVDSITTVRLLDGSETTGNAAITIDAKNLDLDVTATSDSDLFAVAGYSAAESTASATTRANVSGHHGSLLRTAELVVTATQDDVLVDAIASDTDGLFIAGPETELETKDAHRQIFWESRVILLGEPNPELEVDATGTIVKLTNVTVADHLGNPYALGQTFDASDEIVVGPIINNEPASAEFITNDGTAAGLPLSVIWGSEGRFELQHTWDYVRITNHSDRLLRTNLIDVVDGGATISIRVDDIKGPQDPDGSQEPGSVGTTFEFDLEHTFPETAVEIQNLTMASDPSDIVLDGTIENPIGLTLIHNVRGNIIVDTDSDVEVIRTNELDLSAQGGSIGSQGGGIFSRSALWVELVQYQDATLAFNDVEVSAVADIDVVLDLTANRRTSDDPTITPIVVPIALLRAGDDLDIVVNDSKHGDDPGNVADITVNLYDPPSNSPGAGSGVYLAHFRPDVADPGLEAVLKAFGTTTAEAESTYDFAEARAGDDIDIGHVSTTAGFGEPRDYATTQRADGSLPFSVTADPVPDATVHFIINTDVDWTGGSSEDGVEQIFLTTNGDITATELAGSMLVGHIHSTAGDVTLTSPLRILDANEAPTIDVTGDDITMTAGTDGGQGGVGETNDFLEINVNRNNGVGVLTVTDTAGTSTFGVFLEDLLGNMRVDLVHTEGDVTLRTVGGSILDGRKDGAGGDQDAGDGDTAADVIGITIDIDANGGSSDIGEFGNDLDIDSSAGGTGDVSLEAGSDIYLTETDANLRLVMAHAYGGDIRLTVRESADLDEHFELLPSGSARFAESNTRPPGNHTDALRIVPHGQVFAEQGSATVRAGDDVILDDNTEIVAAHDIDIFGDHGNADVDANGGAVGDGHGSTLTLRGRLVAGAVVSLGSQVANPPVGTYLPSAVAPVFETNIWGHTDSDTFQFGDPSGAAGTTIWGQDGYIFIGSPTRVHGSQDVPSTGDDGEDRFFVYFLQDADVTTGPMDQSPARHTLTLDGQADTDTYEVHTLGSNGVDRRSNVINVLDTGAEHDGADELMVFGLDSPDNGIDEGTGAKFPTDDIFLLRAAAFLPSETADRPAYVALLHGDVESYTDIDETTNSSTEVIRINYDAGLNGRLTVVGLGGNDYFASDDTTVNVTLDGGEGFDTFRVGQIFGLKRTDEILEGQLLTQDVFPTMVATTRGWLSPGISAPMVVHGGTGNDEFTVYSNQAELRLEGDDHNDLFIIRAFALAAVSTKDWNLDGNIDAADLDAVDEDSNTDGEINAADADETPNDWTDDIIVLDDEGVAVPKIGRRFSTFRPLDIRTGGGEDEVQYNVNAPVSVDGGTGFDKLVILGTEFADDFAITQSGIFGAGLNARYANVEVVEVDGLEGDDQFYVQSTDFGVAYRVIGGLGSDAIHVTGDVTADIVTRELEGLSGAVDHLVTSEDDPDYDGLTVDGFDYNVATKDEGVVVIRESGSGTAVREGGPTPVDSFFVSLASAPLVPVYVTLSAARSPQEEYDDTLINPPGLPNGAGDSIWLSTTSPADLNNPLDSEFQRTVYIAGVPTQINNRAVVLTFLPGNYSTEQEVFVFAPDDLRAEGDRVVVVNNSVISGDAAFDAADVRNVEVDVRDNDTPGVYVLQVEPGTSVEDGRTLVIEGTPTTRLVDELLVQLAKQPDLADQIVVQLDLDRYEGTEEQIRLIDVLSDPRFDPIARTITFTSANWDNPVRVGIEAWDDSRREDPATAVIFFSRDDATIDLDDDYIFPNLRSGIGAQDIEVIDNETAGAVVLESGGTTLLVPDDLATVPDETETDDYTIRLTKKPKTGATVEVAILTDGLADVLEIDNVAVPLEEIGGYRPTQLFNGSIIFENIDGRGTLTRGTGADLGSFIDEGFTQGQFLRVGGAVGYDGNYYIHAITDKVITLTTDFSVGSPVEIEDTVSVSSLTRESLWEGEVTVEVEVAARRLVRTDFSGWLADLFLEGQRVRVTNLANPGQFADFKIAIIRGDNESFDEKIEFTTEGALPAWLSDGTTLDVRVSRLAPVIAFTDTDWYVQRTVELVADPLYAVPLTRQGVKVFPVSTHLLGKLRGPLAVEGGVTGADRSLQNGLKLPGEKDDFLIVIGAQPPESQQIDILNLFNDSSQQDRTGTMDQTTLRGFGMAQDLDFGELFGLSEEDAETFGESLVFPGGVSFGKINFGSSGFETDAGQTTIEVLNFLGGEGNDTIDVEDTLEPAPQVSASQEFTFAPAPGGGTVFKLGFDWKGQGFLIGQTVQIEGMPGTWTVAAIQDHDPNLLDSIGADPNDNSILVLAGAALPSLTDERLVIGIDALVRTQAVLDAAPTSIGGTLTRVTGDWEDDGFIVGHLVKVEGAGLNGHWRLVGISGGGKILELEGTPIGALNDAPLTVSVAGPHGGLTLLHGGGNAELTLTVESVASGPVSLPGNVTAQGLTRLDGLDWVGDGYAIGQYVQVSGEAMTRQVLGFADADPSLEPADAFDSWGDGSVLLLSGSPIGGGTMERIVHVAEALRTEATGLMEIKTTSLTRSSGNWLTDGFYVGQKVWISGLAGPFTVAGLTSSVMTLQGVALVPKTGVELTVFGFDIQFDGGVRMGGDHITVTGGAGPDSPLVVYGDTSQDGVWYGGHSWDVLGSDFGEKPFDPFPFLPDGDNEDDEWVFPLADPYTHAGHDVIDASALFAGTPAGSLPTVGFVAYGGAGNDVILGSQTGDHLAGGSGDDTILGLRGVDHIYGDSGVNVNVLNRGLTIDTIDNSPAPTLDKNLLSNGTTIPPAASDVRDDLKAGRDVIHGDGPGTVLGGPESVYDDLIFGDHGAIDQNVADPNTPEPLLQKIQTTLLSSVLSLRSLEFQNGDDDVIFGHLGRDVLIGGAGHDVADGDEADDLVFGDNVTSLTRTGGDDGNLFDDIASPRFRTLLGAILYGRSDRTPFPNADGSGVLLTSLIARNYRDPDGAPYWAEYTVDYADLHTFAFDEGEDGVDSFGNDQLAGGQKHDLLFGQLGDDVIQGDGGMESAFAAASHAGASRTPDGAVGTVVDLIGDLDVVPSFEAVTDGEDYIEGGGGNDIVFGGLGQDDILGGSSDFFSLTNPSSRPDGSDVIFGGAGTDISRSHIGDATINGSNVILTTPTGHADDSDTIVGDNGRIVRIVGTNDVDVNPTGNVANPLYLSFKYDDYGPVKMIVRGVALLDHTAGGPDFNPALPKTSGLGGDIFGADEVHGESGDDTIYTGAGNDIVYGDGQDDDIILGWGDDWASGGTGQDGILGDDGRIFTSRNSRSAIPANPGYLVSDGEPLYGVLPLLSTDPDPQHPKIIHGNVLNEFIFTPGMVQAATLFVSGALHKTVDITPFDWNPGSADEPLFDANEADDVIYGGLGDDFLHGSVGDDAIAGSEALNESYSQRYNFDTAALLGIVRSDWTRPYNTGDMLVFGNDDASWHTFKPSPGEFALYDEFDPRRVISLNASGTKDVAGANGHNWFLNFVSNEGVAVPGGVDSKGVPYGPTNNDGADQAFGGHGNDWVVGGTGRDEHWGGWGTDLLQADDVLGTTDGGTADNAPDTSPNYEDRAYAGAGYDILIGNTGGDRLIDWVGEFNTFVVPFSPFGIDTVSRQLPPQLDEFLYALSRSDGADPTRWTDTTIDPDFQPRNGEPFGEIGLITQSDHGLWQDQTGGPTDPQPGDIPGGKRDVLNGADFNSGSFQSFRVDAGVWEVAQGALKVGAASLGKDALGVFYLDHYLPQYYEIAASIMTQKPLAGWKSNAYVVFDYHSPTDYKFAGIDISINKFVMGHRTAAGWTIDEQAPVQVKPDTFYNVLVAVNGTTVTVQLGTRSLTHTFAPRVIDGVAYGLNKGMVGAGSDNARGTWDNFVVQVLPPQLTLDQTEDFNDPARNAFKGDALGAAWSVSGGRYGVTVAPESTSFRTLNLGVDHLLSTSYVELEAVVRTNGVGGVVFDENATNHFKYVALDVNAQKIVIGHNDPRRGMIVDTTVSRALTANRDYRLGLTLKGASVSVTLDGAIVASWGFNAPVVEGGVGVFASIGSTSFDSFRFRTNDPAFEDHSRIVGDDVTVILSPTLPIMGPLPGGTASLTDGTTGTTLGQISLPDTTTMLESSDAILPALPQLYGSVEPDARELASSGSNEGVRLDWTTAVLQGDRPLLYRHTLANLAKQGAMRDPWSSALAALRPPTSAGTDIPLQTEPPGASLQTDYPDDWLILNRN